MNAVLLALAVLLGGCSFSTSADYFKALAQDPATVCVRVLLSTPWGTETTTAARTNPTAPVASVSCPADGGMTYTTK